MRVRKPTPWLLGILAATTLLALVSFLQGFWYIGSDDAPILRSFMGYEGGVPASYHLYLHTALAWLLHGLALAFPGIAWFSLLQLFLLWLSSAVLAKSVMQRGLRCGMPLWQAALAALLFLAAFAAYPAFRVTYTTTGALVGAAAVAQLMSVDFQKGAPGQIFRGMSLSVVLLLLCYCLRQIGVLPPLAFWLLALGLAVLCDFRPFAPKGERRSLSPLLPGLLLCACAFAVFAAVRAVEIRAMNLEGYLAWQNARIRLFDYADFVERTTPETLARVGWTESEFLLVARWFFMNGNITAEAFDALYAAQLKGLALSPGGKAAAAFSLLQTFFAENPAMLPAALALAGMALLCLLLSLFLPGKRSLAPGAAGGLLLGGGLLFFLAWQGRLPFRAAAAVLFPMAAYLFCLSSALLSPATRRARRAAPLFRAAFCLCLGLAALSACQSMAAVFSPYDPEVRLRNRSIPEDLEIFALENPETLVIYDLSLVTDTRMFPDTSRGIPPNILFWGGYPARSPSWTYQLAQYGIDGEAMTPGDFLRENVVVANADWQLLQMLADYVEDHAEGEIDWDFYDECGYVRFFHLYEY